MCNIKMDLGITGWVVMNWIVVALDRKQWMALENTVMNFRLP
jgi:hypothetical protein